MLQAATNSSDLSLLAYTKHFFISLRKYWLLLLGITLNFNLLKLDPILAQSQYDLTLNRNTLSQPVTIQGISGGTITALEIAQTDNTSTGYCDGFANRQPNHILKLDNFFEYLRIEVESSADTTILVRGAGGVWCNDDAGSANPVIEGRWQPGIYQVWVGSYRKNSNNDYKIKITSN